MPFVSALSNTNEMLLTSNELERGQRFKDSLKKKKNTSNFIENISMTQYQQGLVEK